MDPTFLQVIKQQLDQMSFSFAMQDDGCKLIMHLASERGPPRFWEKVIDLWYLICMLVTPVDFQGRNILEEGKRLENFLVIPSCDFLTYPVRRTTIILETHGLSERLNKFTSLGFPSIFLMKRYWLHTNSRTLASFRGLNTGRS
jgi:hypothetical protein